MKPFRTCIFLGTALGLIAANAMAQTCPGNIDKRFQFQRNAHCVQELHLVQCELDGERHPDYGCDHHLHRVRALASRLTKRTP